MTNDTPPSSSSSFDDLPTEVLRSILSYMDVPSLAVLSNSQRGLDGNVSELASDDVTWYSLVRERFGIGRDNRRLRRRRRRYGRCGVRGIGCEEEKEEDGEEGVVVVNKRGGGGRPSSDSTHGGLLRRRPASYGGRDWKSAYRSLSSTMRIPETHLTGGAVFASTSSSTSSALGRRRCGSGGSGGGPADYLGVWCMVNHAENCRTRTVVDARATTGAGGCRPPLGRRRQAASLPYRSDRRYIELKICLQNTKSGYGRLVVPDVRSIRISSHDEEGRRLDDYDDSSSREDRRREEDRRRRRHHREHDDDNGYYHRDEESTFEIVEDGPWAPRIALRRRAFFYDDDPTADFDDATAADDTTKTSVILRPFEVVVLSIHVSCPGCFLYETDALSSMSSVRVPVVADGWPTGVGPAAGSRCGDGGVGGGGGGIGAVDDARGSRRDASIARFLPEDDLWEYYCLLPGGCMSLKDRSRLVPM